MNEKIKYEKIIIPLGRKNVLTAAIRSIERTNRAFKMEMKKLPPIQKLATHYYCYVPLSEAREIKEKYEEIHWDKYGYVD